MFPSAIRAEQAIGIGGDPNTTFGRTMMSLRHTRALYDWYVAYGAEAGITPRIIDADDLMKDREAVARLCRQTGLDPEAVVYEWEEKTVDDPYVKRFLSTINSSRGILPGLTADRIDVEVEKGKWVVEFGEVVGEGLARRVDETMGDYVYLWGKRTTGSKE